MGITEIINLGLATISLMTKAIAAANAGDLTTARKALEDARGRFGAALAAWDAAPGPQP